MEPVITNVEMKEPGLCVNLQAMAPIKEEKYGNIYYEDWTLDLLERTTFEFRAAGAWDESKVSFTAYPKSVSCEVVATPGPGAFPWGWRPSQGEPPEKPLLITYDAGRSESFVEKALGNRVFHGVLLLVILFLIGIH